MLAGLRLLVTNDDNHESPFLHFLLENLADLASLDIIAPKHEQSFTGKGMTVARPLALEKTTIDGHLAYHLDGYPADCINLGIYHVCNERPDLVISGINAGLNCGTSFSWGSGTVGACIEANIQGIPAIAISQHLKRSSMDQWRSTRLLPDEELQRLRDQTKRVLKRVFEFLKKQKNFLCEPLTWNVNLPYNLNDDFLLHLCPLNHASYKSSFIEENGSFVHHIHDVELEENPDSDFHLLLKGEVPISVLNYRNICVSQNRLEIPI